MNKTLYFYLFTVTYCIVKQVSLCYHLCNNTYKVIAHLCFLFFFFRNREIRQNMLRSRHNERCILCELYQISERMMLGLSGDKTPDSASKYVSCLMHSFMSSVICDLDADFWKADFTKSFRAFILLRASFCNDGKQDNASAVWTTWCFSDQKHLYKKYLIIWIILIEIIKFKLDLTKNKIR